MATDVAIEHESTLRTMKPRWSDRDGFFMMDFPPDFTFSSHRLPYSCNDSQPRRTNYHETPRERTMKSRALIGIAAAALLIAGAASAQQPRDSMRMPVRMGDTTGMMSGGMMRDAGDARLDSLVQAMNQATGNRKVQAMAAVINELVAERRAMHEHMRQMMGHGGKMGGAARELPPDSGRSKDAPADSAGRTEHHDS
jgi:hypothetical protein